jgi:hypothetical protein
VKWKEEKSNGKWHVQNEEAKLSGHFSFCGFLQVECDGGMNGCF